MITNPAHIPTYPGANYTRPSGAACIESIDHPEVLALALLYGNRQTRRLAEQKILSSRHRKLMNQIKGDL